jgi:cardiolipin synthase
MCREVDGAQDYVHVEFYISSWDEMTGPFFASLVAATEPYVLHAKHFTVDDSLAVIGSSNMDMRSFALNYEVVLMLTGTRVVDRLREVQDEYRRLSTELTREVWRERGWGSKYVDNVMRLTAALQ